MPRLIKNENIPDKMIMKPYIVCHMTQSIDGRIGQPALFDGIADSDKYRPLSLKFKEISTFSNGVIWARYSVL